MDSPDYQTLVTWVSKGAPYGEEEQEVKVERLEVFPKEAVLKPTEQHQLLVTAYFSDGRREDFTSQVHYELKNPQVAEITPEGRLKGIGPGETFVLIRAAGQSVNAPVGVIERSIPNYAEVPRNNFIDDHVFAKLRRFHIQPSELSTDGEFLRRVCLDITGSLPPPERVRELLNSQEPQKREKLIETLLDSPEYLDYWTLRISDFFASRV